MLIRYPKGLALTRIRVISVKMFYDSNMCGRYEFGRFLNYSYTFCALIESNKLIDPLLKE